MDADQDQEWWWNTLQAGARVGAGGEQNRPLMECTPGVETTLSPLKGVVEPANGKEGYPPTRSEPLTVGTGSS